MPKIDKILETYWSGHKMPWARAAVAGGFVFFAGAEGMDPETAREGGVATVRVPYPGGIKEQAETAFKKIKATLEEAGSSLDNIVYLCVIMRNFHDFPEFIEVSRKYIDQSRIPNTFIQAGLWDGIDVEIEGIAVIPDK